MILRLIPFLLLPLLTMNACRDEGPKPSDKAAETEAAKEAEGEAKEAKDDKAKEAFPEQKSLEDQLAEGPEPELNPEEPRETFELLKGKAPALLKGIYEERMSILEQMRELRFPKGSEDAAKKVRAWADQIEDYSIGYVPRQFETAAERFCTLIETLRAEAGPVEKEGQEILKELSGELEALEKKQEEGGKVATSQYEKLEEAQKSASAPVLGAGYVWLAMKTLFQEAFVLVDFGPRRAQLTIRDCVGGEDYPAIPYELTEKERQKTAQRARYYRTTAE